MHDLKSFRAPFLARDVIWEQADQFRGQYWPSGEIPVDVLAITEHGLDIEIRPINDLKSDCDIDALLLRDEHTLLVDSTQFTDDRYYNRIRFSVAHELGHLVLHKDVYPPIVPTCLDEWIQIIDLIPEDQYRWVENHANEFAGRLLVPPVHLKEHVTRAVELAETHGANITEMDADTVRDYVATAIYRPFQVSPDVISRRLRFEADIWPPA